ncbi:MAG TPA: YraN family protein [Moraxellaceae bacterium]|nr:YraN family protein [Moraxellaceae bacterium]
MARNWRGRRGEIDLVVRQQRLLVFAEVRLRNRDDFGGAAASVTAAKQRKIIATARAFLQHHPEFCACDCRFDVVAVRAGPTAWRVRWWPGAFTT